MFEVTAANFQQLVLESPVPVLLDVYADWCGPCKQLVLNASLYSSLLMKLVGCHLELVFIDLIFRAKTNPRNIVILRKHHSSFCNHICRVPFWRRQPSSQEACFDSPKYVLFNT